MVQNKNSRTFISNIRAILKSISTSKRIRISGMAIKQVDEFICILTYKISTIARNNTIQNGRAGISRGDVEMALRTFLYIHDGEMINKVMSAVEIAIKRWNDFHSQVSVKRKNPVRLEKQSKLNLSVSLVEYIMRDYSTSKINVGKVSRIALTAAIDYIVTSLLKMAYKQMDSTRTTMDIRDIFLAAQFNYELKRIIDVIGIEFLGSGVVPDKKLLIVNSCTKKGKTTDKTISTIQSLQQTVDLKFSIQSF
jgi:histone H3/H4